MPAPDWLVVLEAIVTDPLVWVLAGAPNVVAWWPERKRPS